MRADCRGITVTNIRNSVGVTVGIYDPNLAPWPSPTPSRAGSPTLLSRQCSGTGRTTARSTGRGLPGNAASTTTPALPDVVLGTDMVTKVAGNQGQITLKGVPITDEWQALVTVAAKRNGQTFAEFVADVTRAAALAIVKGEAAVTAAVPIRLEDLATGLEARIVALAEEQRDRLDRIERASRRGRWRR